MTADEIPVLEGQLTVDDVLDDGLCDECIAWLEGGAS